VSGSDIPLKHERSERPVGCLVGAGPVAPRYPPTSPAATILEHLADRRVDRCPVVRATSESTTRTMRQKPSRASSVARRVVTMDRAPIFWRSLHHRAEHGPTSRRSYAASTRPPRATQATPRLPNPSCTSTRRCVRNDHFGRRAPGRRGAGVLAGHSSRAIRPTSVH
jgi:hypothetical protein